MVPEKLLGPQHTIVLSLFPGKMESKWPLAFPETPGHHRIVIISQKDGKVRVAFGIWNRIEWHKLLETIQFSIKAKKMERFPGFKDQEVICTIKSEIISEKMESIRAYLLS